jgi:two-component system, chemotaxis family, sensor kinase Cph1
MNELVARVVSSFEFQTREAGTDLSTGELPPCQGDEVQVTQVFANLVGNALKFIDPARPGKITVSGAIEQGRPVYCVEDNGIGIAPEQKESVFELFHRLDPSRGDGEGLGLTIVKQIRGRLDGEIRVESKLGKGSRFYVRLPAARPDKTTKEQEVRP